VTTGAADVAEAPQARRKGARQLIASLKRRLAADGEHWMDALFDTVSQWPLAGEAAFEREFTYLIDGEAFDWVLLVERLLLDPELDFPVEARERLIGTPGFPDGMSESEFRKRVGLDKHRAYLNYHYGVTVEQALLLAVEEEIRKRRYSNGHVPGDSRLDDAYLHLYGESPGNLLKEFRKTRPDLSDNPRIRIAKTLSMQEASAFTYWLFKRRLERADPARLASDTKKGLDQLARMRAAHARRVREGGRRSVKTAR